MKKHPRRRPLALAPLLLAALCLAGCRLTPRPEAAPTPPGLAGIVHAAPGQKEAESLLAELGGDDGFFQVVHFLYRWTLDENDFQRRDLALQRQLWLRRLQVVTDENDKSRYMEAVFPALGVTVTLKKTDYRIPELKLDVRSSGYRVVRISREPRSAADAADYAQLAFDPDALYARLFQARFEAEFPGDELLARLRASIAEQVAELKQPAAAERESTVYFAPVHAVANEIWAYWEEGKLLFHFTSDIDLNNPAVWGRETLNASIYDIVEQTVVSHEEKPGDDRYLTRDQVGRALYNCLALGKKTAVPSD